LENTENYLHTGFPPKQMECWCDDKCLSPKVTSCRYESKYQPLQ